jgi:hypothetical protein
MHPEIEGIIRESAREYLARELMEKGLYAQAAESDVLSFDDIYFLGVCQASENIALDFICQRDERRCPRDLIDDELRERMFLESSRLVARLYASTSEQMMKRWKDIQERFACWIHSRCESR